MKNQSEVITYRIAWEVGGQYQSQEFETIEEAVDARESLRKQSIEPELRRVMTTVLLENVSERFIKNKPIPHKGMCCGDMIKYEGEMGIKMSICMRCWEEHNEHPNWNLEYEKDEERNVCTGYRLTCPVELRTQADDASWGVFSYELPPKYCPYTAEHAVLSKIKKGKK
jgi:hypothetical protein